MPAARTPPDAEAQIAFFIDKFDPAIAALARACRAAMHLRMPNAFELVYDNYNALAIGYDTSDRASDCILSLAVFPKTVNLSFYYGAGLPDPRHRLQGSGAQNRFVRLESPATLQDPEIEALVAASISQSKRKLPQDGGIITIIKSVSARQRARRPKVARRFGKEGLLF